MVAEGHILKCSQNCLSKCYMVEEDSFSLSSSPKCSCNCYTRLLFSRKHETYWVWGKCSCENVTYMAVVLKENTKNVEWYECLCECCIWLLFSKKIRKILSEVSVYVNVTYDCVKIQKIFSEVNVHVIVTFLSPSHLNTNHSILSYDNLINICNILINISSFTLHLLTYRWIFSCNIVINHKHFSHLTSLHLYDSILYILSCNILIHINISFTLSHLIYISPILFMIVVVPLSHEELV
jgi:hypothetical protein